MLWEEMQNEVKKAKFKIATGKILRISKRRKTKAEREAELAQQWRQMQRERIEIASRAR